MFARPEDRGCSTNTVIIDPFIKSLRHPFLPWLYGAAMPKRFEMALPVFQACFNWAIQKYFMNNIIYCIICIFCFYVPLFIFCLDLVSAAAYTILPKIYSTSSSPSASASTYSSLFPCSLFHPSPAPSPAPNPPSPGSATAPCPPPWRKSLSRQYWRYSRTGSGQGSTRSYDQEGQDGQDSQEASRRTWSSGSRRKMHTEKKPQ